MFDYDEDDSLLFFLLKNEPFDTDLIKDYIEKNEDFLCKDKHNNYVLYYAYDHLEYCENKKHDVFWGDTLDSKEICNLILKKSILQLLEDFLIKDLVNVCVDYL
jgi:hypothetical protein